MWASSASRLWECWLPEERPAPNWVRTVSAIWAAPPVMNGSFAAWLSSWSRQTPTKSRYISSTTGRIPAIAAPTPRPMIAVSEIGVSRTRSPNRSRRPRVSPKTLPPAPTSIPATKTRSSAASSASRASWIASIVRKTGASSPGSGGSGASGLGRTTKSNSVVAAGLGQWPGPPRRRRPARCATDASSAAIVVVADAAGAEASGVDDERVPRLPLLDLLGRSVALRVALVVAVPPVGGRLDDDAGRARPARTRPPPA